MIILPTFTGLVRLARVPLRFLLVGLFNSFVGILVFALLLTFFGTTHYIEALATAHFAVVSLSFFLYRIWVFETSTSPVRRFFWFQGLQMFNLVLAMGFMVVMVEFGDVSPLACQILVAPLSGVLNYLGSRFIVFTSKTKGKFGVKVHADESRLVTYFLGNKK